MKYKFNEIFDIPALTELCQSFTDINGVVTALLDLEGNVHIATGWQDICTKFHRKNAQTSCRCHESDTYLANQLDEGKEYNVYHCKNGLVDVAVPVMIKGEHVANIFTGQFFFNQPEVDFFKKQADEFGFDESAYIDALKRTPVYSEKEIKINIAFLVKLTQIIGEMCQAKLELLETNENLDALVKTDSLTGVFNRGHFTEQIGLLLNLSSRNNSPLQMIMIDIDFFKSINDTYGHQAGDKVLKTLSEFLSSKLRETDVLGRLGGEEFGLVLQNTNSIGGDFFAEKLREGVEKLSLEVDGNTIKLTISIGIAEYLSEDDYDGLSKKADKALYEAKDSGRNKVVRYSDKKI